MPYVLANGAKILSLALTLHHDGGCHGVVLADAYNLSRYEPFVTWSVWADARTGELQAVNGRYFPTKVQASDDYLTRIPAN